MVIEVTKDREKLLNHAYVVYGILLILTALLLYFTYVLSSVIANIVHYALYW